MTVGGRAAGAGKVELFVRDDDPASRPTRAREIESFYRVDRACARETGGPGFGLSIVKHIVQAHGGEVWLTSELGEGTTFLFTLPKG